jgi:branched-subunit amino acid ABC-type transport system permease component
LDLFLQVLVVGLTTGAIYAAIAAGFGLSLGCMGVVDFTYGAYVVAGAVVAASLPSIGVAVVDFIARALAAMLVSGLLATTVCLFILDKLILRGHLAQLVATLGAALVLQGALHYLAGSDLIAPPHRLLPGMISIGHVMVMQQRLLAATLGIATIIALGVVLTRTSLGKAWQAVAENEVGAVIAGLRIRMLRLLAALASGLLAGLAGALLVQMISIDVFQGVPFLLIAFFVVALGGLGSTGGLFVAAIVFAIIQSMADVYAPELLKSSIAYMTIAVAIVLLPRGVASLWSARARAV